MPDRRSRYVVEIFVGSALLIVVVAVIGHRFLRPNSLVTKANYDLLRLGMSVEEVEGILGKGHWERDEVHFPTEQWDWDRSHRKGIRVTFGFGNDKTAKYKEYFDETSGVEESEGDPERPTYARFGGKQKEQVILHQSDSVVSIAFTPDGKTLITSAGKAIRLFDVASRKEQLALIRGRRSGSKAIAVSPDGEYLASGNWDTTVRLWDIASGAEIATLTGHTGPLLTVAFSPDGSLLATGGRDKAEVKLWDLRTRSELASLSGVGSHLAFSPDGKTVAVGDKGRLVLWDVVSKQARPCINGPDYVSEVIWSRDGKRLILGGTNIRICDPVTGKVITTLPVGDDTDEAYGLAITKDDRLLVSGSHRGNIKIWDIARREVRLTLIQAPPKRGGSIFDEVYCVALSPDDTLLAAGVGHTVRIWDIKALLSASTDPMNR